MAPYLPPRGRGSGFDAEVDMVLVLIESRVVIVVLFAFIVVPLVSIGLPRDAGIEDQLVDLERGDGAPGRRAQGGRLLRWQR